MEKIKMYREYYPSYLVHHGIKGQRWGDRKYQNLDGSLTPEGRVRYGYGQANGMHGGSGIISAPTAKRSANQMVSGKPKKQKFKFFDTSKERGNYIIENANRKHQGDSYQKQVNRARRNVIIKRFGGALLPNITGMAASRAINLAGNIAMYKTNGKFMWTRERQAIVDRSIRIISSIQNGYQVAKGVQEMRALNRAAPMKIKKRKKRR